MNIYWVIHYLVEGVKIAIFTWESESNYREFKMIKKCQYPNVNFI